LFKNHGAVWIGLRPAGALRQGIVNEAQVVGEGLWERGGSYLGVGNRRKCGDGDKRGEEYWN